MFRFAKSGRSDLIIGMTLAEIFLLLLFVVWYAYGGKKIITWGDFQRALDEAEMLRSELTQAAQTIEDLHRRLEVWRQSFDSFGLEEDSLTPEKVGTWIKDVCRDNPRCEDNNILIGAEVINGVVAVNILAESPRFRSWLENRGHTPPRVALRINQRDSIEIFLGQIRQYYNETGADGKECRFDYNLSYYTKEDYFDGRQLFERYFYPAALRQVLSVDMPSEL